MDTKVVLNVSRACLVVTQDPNSQDVSTYLLVNGKCSRVWGRDQKNQPNNQVLNWIAAGSAMRSLNDSGWHLKAPNLLIFNTLLGLCIAFRPSTLAETVSTGIYSPVIRAIYELTEEEARQLLRQEDLDVQLLLEGATA